MEYNCGICNYSTKYVSNYHKHNRTSGHKKKVSEQVKDDVIIKVDKDKDKYTCKFCDCSFDRKSSLVRHKKVCTEYEMEEKDYKIKMLELEIEHLKKQNFLLEKLVKE